MRKIITYVCLVISCLALLLSGCSCETKTVLNFTAQYTGGDYVQTTYKEICEYNVEFGKDNDLIVPTTKVDECALKVKDVSGTFKTTLEIVSSLPESIDSDIRQKLDNKKVLHLQTRLDLDVDYFNPDTNSDKINEDFIESDVYLCDESLSFAPIYVKTTSSETIFFLTKENPTIGVITKDYVTQYNETNYKVSGTKTFSIGDKSSSQTDDYTKNYQFRTVIDNASLLFCTRNLSSKTTNYLSVFSLSYDTDKSLSIVSKDTLKRNADFTFNGNLIDSLDVNKFSMQLTDANQSGMSQYYFIQNAETSVIKNYGLLVKYVIPVMDYGTTTCLGSLSFNLTRVTTNA